MLELYIIIILLIAGGIVAQHYWPQIVAEFNSTMKSLEDMVYNHEVSKINEMYSKYKAKFNDPTLIPKRLPKLPNAFKEVETKIKKTKRKSYVPPNKITTPYVPLSGGTLPVSNGGTGTTQSYSDTMLITYLRNKYPHVNAALLTNTKHQMDMNSNTHKVESPVLSWMNSKGKNFTGKIPVALASMDHLDAQYKTDVLAINFQMMVNEASKMIEGSETEEDASPPSKQTPVKPTPPPGKVLRENQKPPGIKS